MKIWTALIMIVTLATVVAVSAAIGALAGGFASLIFLLNAKENGGKGLS